MKNGWPIQIAVLFLLAFMSLGLGASGSVASGMQTDHRVLTSVAHGCDVQASHKRCGSAAQDCGITCSLQAFVLPGGQSQLRPTLGSMIEYPRSTDGVPGDGIAPSPYPPRASEIS